MKAPSNDRAPLWFRRAGRAMLLAGVLCATAVGYRTVQIQRAAQQQHRMNLVQVPVDDLDGGFVIRPVRRGFRLGRPGLTSRLLADGEVFQIDRTEFVFHEARRGKSRVEVMSVPMRVFAARETEKGPKGGFQRIDIGGDPVGAATGTRDRIYVDHRAVLEQLDPSAQGAFEKTRGVAYLVPAEGDVFRLDQQSMRVVAEVPGITRTRGEDELELAAGGASVELAAGDHLSGPGFDLQIAVQERWRSHQVSDSNGRVVAQRQVLEPQFTVTTPVEGEGADGGQAFLSFVDRSGKENTVRLSTTRPNMLFGGGDRLRPLQGRVIPETVEHRELQERFVQGVEQGIITLRRGFVIVDPGENDPGGYYEEVGPTITNQLVRLARQYNRGQVPGTIAVKEIGVGLGLAEAGAWSLRVDGHDVPPTGVSLDEGGLLLPPPGEFDAAALAPSEAAHWSLIRSLAVSEATSGAFQVRSALPISVLLDGRELAHVRGSAITIELALEPGEHELELAARYTGRPSGYGQLAGVRADLGGAEPVEAYAGRRRFLNWTETFDGGRTWTPAREGEGGRLWVQPTAPQDEALTGYLQVRFYAPAAGPNTLEIALDGHLEDAYFNGVPLPAAALPYLPGESARVPVAVKRGSNLLAMRVRQTTATPDESQGGIRLQFVGGVLTGLHPQTERRAMRASGTPWKREPALATRASVPLRLTVAREIPGLPEGSEWLVGTGGDGESLLILADETMPSTTVFELEPDLTVRYQPDSAAPFQVVNRTSRRVDLFRQEDPMRRPYQPFGGFAIYAGRAEPLKHDRDAVRGRSTQVTYRTGGVTLLGSVHVVRDGELHRLIADGGGKLVPGGVSAERLHVRRQGDRLELVGAADGTAIYRDGAVRVTLSGPSDLPVEILDGDALSCPGGLLLVASADAIHPQDGGALAQSLEPVREASLALSSGRARGESPHVSLTIDPVLQAAGVDEMRAQLELVERIYEDAGLDYEPGPEGLVGGLVILDAVTGEILTAISEEADGPGAAGVWGVAWTHPGSTYKIVTALTALSSTDPQVRAMLDGELPAGLFEAASGTLRGAEISRLAAGDGRWASDESDPIRLRSSLQNFRRAPLPLGTDLTGGMGMSSNLYFGFLSLLMYKPFRESWETSGIANPELRDELVPLAGMAHQLGFDTVLDLVPSSLGHCKSRQLPLTDAGGRPVAPGDALYGWTGSFPEGLLSDPEMAACGVGQGEVYATPLQMARVAAVVANGGKLVQPTLISAVDGQQLAPDAPTPLALPADAPGRVRKGMRRVVAAGTASTPMSDNPYRERIFGKTGSSERPGTHGSLLTDSWFVGVLEPADEDVDSPDPARHPQVVVCVMPSAGLGGTHAADVADRMIRHMARRFGQAIDER